MHAPVLPPRGPRSSVRRMTHPAPSEADGPHGFTVDEYLGLIDAGVLEPDDRTELLDGVVVVKMTHSPRHAAGVRAGGSGAPGEQSGIVRSYRGSCR